MKVEEQGVSCLICMSNASNVVTIPCNHLALCIDCFTEMKDRFDTGQIHKLECPVCRTEIDPQQKIMISYKPLLSPQDRVEIGP